MTLTLALIMTVLCAWAMLRVLGGERERQLQEAQLRAANVPAAEPVHIARSTPFKPPSGPVPTPKPAAAAPAGAASAASTPKPAR